MQIDLLISSRGELGLLSSDMMSQKVSAVIYSPEEASLTLEYGQSMDTLPLNVAVATHLGTYFHDEQYSIHIGFMKDGKLAKAGQVKLITGDFTPFGDTSSESISSFMDFMEHVTEGQAVHRDDVADEGSNSSVTGGVSPAALAMAPQLKQELKLERSQTLQNVPRFTPPSLTPGGSSAPGGPQNLDLSKFQPKPPKGESDK